MLIAPIAVTDCNVLVGKMPEYFPQVFGAGGNTSLSNQGDRCDRSRLEKKAAGKGLRDRADVDLSFFN